MYKKHPLIYDAFDVLQSNRRCKKSNINSTYAKFQYHLATLMIFDMQIPLLILSFNDILLSILKHYKIN